MIAVLRHRVEMPSFGVMKGLSVVRVTQNHVLDAVSRPPDDRSGSAPTVPGVRIPQARDFSALPPL